MITTRNPVLILGMAIAQTEKTSTRRDLSSGTRVVLGVLQGVRKYIAGLIRNVSIWVSVSWTKFQGSFSSSHGLPVGRPACPHDTRKSAGCAGDQGLLEGCFR